MENKIMKYYMFILILISTISCSLKNTNLGDNKQKDSLDADINIITSSCTFYPIVFDSLTERQQREYVNTFRSKLSPIVLKYYGKYKEIKDIDIVADILPFILFDSISDINIIPLNVFVLNELNKNKYIDGYVGEFVSEKYYNLFMEQPGYYYQYLNYLKHEDRLDEMKDILYMTFNISINMYSLPRKDLDTILIKHQTNLSNYDSIIKLVKDFVGNNFEQIKTKNDPPKIYNPH
ncbi:hypothetical protein [Dysgonomonas sp.]